MISKRHRHALAAGGAATLAYLAAAELGSKKPVRAGALIMLGMTVMGKVANAGASSKLNATAQRLSAHVTATAPAVNLVANGGSIGGAVTAPSINSIGTSQGSYLATVTQQGTRADFNWVPDTHQGSAPATYAQSALQNCIDRVSHILDQLSAVSDRCDYIVGDLLHNANIAS